MPAEGYLGHLRIKRVDPKNRDINIFIFVEKWTVFYCKSTWTAIMTGRLFCSVRIVMTYAWAGILRQLRILANLNKFMRQPKLKTIDMASCTFATRFVNYVYMLNFFKGRFWQPMKICQASPNQLTGIHLSRSTGN